MDFVSEYFGVLVGLATGVGYWFFHSFNQKKIDSSPKQRLISEIQTFRNSTLFWILFGIIFTAYSIYLDDSGRLFTVGL